jgi:putative mRNA 3-end processing factor
VLTAYSLGKTQRVLGLLRRFTYRPALLDPAAASLTECYRREGVELLPTRCLSSLAPRESLVGELVIAPSSFLSGAYTNRLGSFETAFASGWMAGGTGYGRGAAYDKGFTLSDHADWPALLRTVEETRARRVYVQHRGHGALVRELRARGFEAFPDSELAKPRNPQLSLFGAAAEGRVGE